MITSNSKQNYNRGFGRAGLVIGMGIFILAAGFITYQIFIKSAPELKGTEALSVLSAHKTVTLHARHVRSLEISVIQGGKSFSLLKDRPEGSEKAYPLEIKPKTMGLSEGEAVISVNAESGMFKKLRYDIRTVVDTVPPVLEVVKTPEIINQGGTGFLILRSQNADKVLIKLEESAFPAFRASESSRAGAVEYYVFFPVPYDIKAGAVFHAVATDAAGNQNVQTLHFPMKPASYRYSSITIDDAFINTVASSLLNETNITNHEQAFKKVNEDLRAQALEKIRSLTEKTEPRMLWKDAFLQMKNSKVMAVYGDKRSYGYQGRTISHSVHLGYDLASSARVPVEAANSGIVRYAGDLSIYGNTVIIDHGLGLMSLYGHLSMINVEAGQTVAKGEMIGRTGSTGLAGGDHLHFGIIVHGYEVSPLFWWDQHWIRVNILDHLNA